jgi:hypothetical protein
LPRWADVAFQVARHRGDDLDLLGGEEFRKALLAGHFEDGEVAAVHHAGAHGARRRHQSAKIRIEFRRAAGDVERADPPSLNEFKHRVGDVRRQFLGAVRARADMAMDARLIAAIAYVDLQGVEPSAPDRRKRDFREQQIGVVHRRKMAEADGAVTPPPRKWL